MKIYVLKAPWYPSPVPFAQTFTSGGVRGAKCPHGITTAPFLTQPLVITWDGGTRWEPASDVIADFTDVISSTRRMIARREVFDELAARFGVITPGPIEMVQNPKLKRPTRITKRTRKRVWLPYEGPPLVEIWTEQWAHCDLARSSLERGLRCELCPWSGVWGIRPGGVGLVVSRAELQGADIFRTWEIPSLLVTERVKGFILERGYTNIDFIERGQVVD
jgi:hypothetical protein